jgi:hypothetical protein
MVETMRHPEAYDEGYEDPIKYARPRAQRENAPAKEQLRSALNNPTQIPDDALFESAKYSDGSDERFLRRLWRDLDPDEPVPGGDEEFREDLRRVVNGEVDLLPSTVRVYGQRFNRPGVGPGEFGRRIWREVYPNEPLPENHH